MDFQQVSSSSILLLRQPEIITKLHHHHFPPPIFISQVITQLCVQGAYYLMLLLRILHIRFDGKESLDGRALVKEINIHDYGGKSEGKSLIFRSSQSLPGSMYQDDNAVRISQLNVDSVKKSSTDDSCLLLHYKTCTNPGINGHECILTLSGLDIHCDHFVIGVLVGFIDKLSKLRASIRVAPNPSVNGKNCVPSFVSSFRNSGFSNFFETCFPDWASILLDDFPFITLKDTDSLLNLGGFSNNNIPEWQKSLNSRDWKIKNPKGSIEDRSNGVNQAMQEK